MMVVVNNLNIISSISNAATACDQGDDDHDDEMIMKYVDV